MNKKLKIGLFIFSTIIPVILFLFGGLFLLIILLGAAASTDDGDGTITRQVSGSSHYYQAYKSILKNHLSINANTKTKGYVTLSRTVLFYSILMDDYCASQNSTTGYLPSKPSYQEETACEKYNRLYSSPTAYNRSYTNLLNPLNGDNLDLAYAELIENKDSIALAKFNEAYEMNLDERFRMVGVYDACSNLQEKIGRDVCSNDDVKLYLDSLVNSNSESVSSPNHMFVYPLDYGVGIVSSVFNVERNIHQGNVVSTGLHSGWDISAPENSPVYSVCDGTVTSISNEQKTNVSGEKTNFIIVKCDEVIVENEEDQPIQIQYWHLYPDSIKVSVGDYVKQGDHIAGVGTTGNSTANHLHLGVRYVNNFDRKLDAFYYIDWTSYFEKFLDEEQKDIEYDPSLEEENDDEATSFDEELEEKLDESNTNSDSEPTTKPLPITPTSPSIISPNTPPYLEKK